MADESPPMRLITQHLPEKVLEDIDELVKHGFVPNRAEFIRWACIICLKFFTPESQALRHKNENENGVNREREREKESKKT